MEVKHKKIYAEEDVIKERVDHLIEHRIPWLFLGVIGGLLTAIIVSRYEEILSVDIRLAFFIPLIVYLSGAVGMQTETIYVRELSERKNICLMGYIFKESFIGFGLGIFYGMLLGVFSFFWLKSFAISLTISLTILINLILAPILAVFIPSILYKKNSDPALGAGPMATIIQDLISLLVYFFLASIIIL